MLPLKSPSWSKYHLKWQVTTVKVDSAPHFQPHLLPHCWIQPVRYSVTFLMLSRSPWEQLSNKGSRDWMSVHEASSVFWYLVSASARISSTMLINSDAFRWSTNSSRRFCKCKRTLKMNPSWIPRSLVPPSHTFPNWNRAFLRTRLKNSPRSRALKAVTTAPNEISFPLFCFWTHLLPTQKP